MATLENVVMEEDEAGNNAKEEDELPDDVLRMSTDELISRTRLLDNEVRKQFPDTLTSYGIICWNTIPQIGEDNAVRGDADPT